MANARSDLFVQHIRDGVLAGDGAIGTLLYERGIGIHVNADSLNLDRADQIGAIHEEYISAGAQLIETNTYGANRFKLAKFGLEKKTREINLAGARIARKAAGKEVFVAGAVGPLAPTEIGGGPVRKEEQVRKAFEEQVIALAEGGVDLILLETFSDLDEILIALDVAKEKTGLPVGCQLAFVERGRTVQGAEAVDALARLEKAGAAFVGTNCGRGPKAATGVIEKMGQASQLPLSAFPNAGFPQFLGGRYYYLMTPEYLAESAKDLVAAGANLIGGCCGTTP
ncbi:MAG: homocysteine S-methyltransferase family protein, partial [Planctomycetota bacterium]|nr:homocysteine S-methyltransferase family protein [Planctomycetota bacterium]